MRKLANFPKIVRTKMFSGTNPCSFPFPKHRLRCRHSQWCITSSFFYFIMATSMINSSTNPNCIHPNKILCFLIPRSFKFLLAYWTWGISKCGVIRDRYVFIFRVILGCNSSSQRFRCLYPIGRF